MLSELQICRKYSAGFFFILLSNNLVLILLAESNIITADRMLTFVVKLSHGVRKRKSDDVYMWNFLPKVNPFHFAKPMK